MLKKCLFLLALTFCALESGLADTIQLRDKAAITGTVLAEKRDQIAVDVGYTVLVIPRNQVLKILKTDAPETAVKPVASSKPSPTVESGAESLPSFEAKSGFYSSASKPPASRAVRELVNQLGEAVVQVRTPGGLGSGFILNADGFLMTNFHVIEGETQISVEVYLQKSGELERKVYKQVRIIAINKFADLALLKIDDKDAPKFKYVLLGSADALSVGEGVFAIGSPLGLERTVTEGILSTKTRQLAGELYLQTTTQINPGNSGGPLFNFRGEVVGITNMKIVFGEGLGFAIPVESVKYFLDHRDAYAYSNDNPSNAYRYLEPPSRTRKNLAEE
ncbi:MAG TPA: trypsin-like peptidase domain-containing protein [Candidatus Binatia bacterium]|jgi:serine protease Do|nr:trypsin-like peptidase domain-containing protein [Candidatus Binatia bacterium]